VRDQPLLINRVHNDPSERVRCAAVGRLTDLAVLRELVRDAEAEAVREAAVERLVVLEGGEDEPFWDEESQP
jgi:hypothetical protein